MRVDKQESVIGELETYPALIKTSQYLLGMEDKECFFGGWRDLHSTLVTESTTC